MVDKQIIDKIIAYEQGGLSQQEVIDLFAHLIQSGLCWQLQGHYGRTAEALIAEGLIDGNGKITKFFFSEDYWEKQGGLKWKQITIR